MKICVKDDSSVLIRTTLSRLDDHSDSGAVFIVDGDINERWQADRFDSRFQQVIASNCHSLDCLVRCASANGLHFCAATSRTTPAIAPATALGRDRAETLSTSPSRSATFSSTSITAVVAACSSAPLVPGRLNNLNLFVLDVADPLLVGTSPPGRF